MASPWWAWRGSNELGVDIMFILCFREASSIWGKHPLFVGRDVFHLFLVNTIQLLVFVDQGMLDYQSTVQRRHRLKWVYVSLLLLIDKILDYLRAEVHHILQQFQPFSHLNWFARCCLSINDISVDHKGNSTSSDTILPPKIWHKPSVTVHKVYSVKMTIHQHIKSKAVLKNNFLNSCRLFLWELFHHCFNPFLRTNYRLLYTQYKSFVHI